MNEKPWLAHYDEGVPATVAPYAGTLLGKLDEAVKQRPEAAAVWFKGTTLTWRQIDELSNQFANALIGMGVKKGEPVSSLLVNSPQAVIAQLGCWKAGAVYAPLNPLYTERELEELLNTSDARVMLVLTPFYGRIKALQAKTKLGHVIATRIREYLPFILRLLFIAFREKKGGHQVTLAAGDRYLPDVLAEQTGKARPSVVIAPDDNALLLGTGGTTGIPKVAIGTHAGLYAAGKQIRNWFKDALEDWQSYFCLPLPLFHVFGNGGALSTSLYGHFPLALVPDPRDIKDLAETIGKTKPAFFIGVPTLYIALLNNPEVKEGKLDFHSMKACISGAAPLLAETKTSFEKLTGGRIVEGYSLTEAMMACCINPYKGEFKLGSVGMPVCDVTVRIADALTGEGALPTGEVGEILVNAPQVMKGYWGQPEATTEMVQMHDGVRWLHTGDLGYLDEDGYLFIVDRKKDLIKPGGYQVWPREVEEVLSQHPAVQEVAVAGIPDTYKGEAVAAWIVLKAGSAATVDEIRAFCKERMAAFKVPSRIEFRETLPKTMVGKVLRRSLVDEFKQKSQ